MILSLLEKKKFRLRKKLKARLGRLSAGSREKKSERITERLLADPAWKKARSLMTYVSTEREVETRPLILKALALRKKVYVPCVNQKRKTLKAVLIRDLSKSLIRGAYGIMEPKISRQGGGRPVRLDLIVVPGLGFDKQKRRLGRGGGYFDRFLMKRKGTPKIGIAFREQCVGKVPSGARDVRMDRVITD